MATNEIKNGCGTSTGAVLESKLKRRCVSKGSTSVHLLLFNQADDAYPSRTITLDPYINHGHRYWHIFVPGIGVGQIYGTE